jgi:hypothetical protein
VGCAAPDARKLVQEPMTMQNESTVSDLPTCACGTDRTCREATPERDYSVAGAVYALWGGTSVPSSVSFRCVRCGVVFDTRNDLATRRAFIM